MLVENILQTSMIIFRSFLLFFLVLPHLLAIQRVHAGQVLVSDHHTRLLLRNRLGTWGHSCESMLHFSCNWIMLIVTFNTLYNTPFREFLSLSWRAPYWTKKGTNLGQPLAKQEMSALEASRADGSSTLGLIQKANKVNDFIKKEDLLLFFGPKIYFSV